MERFHCICACFFVNIQKKQGSSAGIVMNAIWQWHEPFSYSKEDKSVAERAQSFYLN